MEIIDLELKTLQSGHDFQSEGQSQKILKICKKNEIFKFWKKRNTRHTL